MPVPVACPVNVLHDDRTQLEALIRAHSTPQALAFRCRLILRVAASDQPTNLQGAADMPCDRHTVSRWRQRYLAQGRPGLQDAPRCGRPRRFSPR